MCCHLPWIKLVCPLYLTDAWLDWDLLNLEAKSTPQTCFSPPTNPERCLLCGTLSYWKRPQPGKTVCMKGFTWSATMLRMVLRVKVTSSITLPLPACLLPMVHPGTICSPGNRPTNTRPSTWNIKENMIHRTRPPSSIAPLSSSDAHMPIVGSFLTGLRLCSPICNKLGCTVYPDTFLSEPTWTFSAIWETAVFGLDNTRPP